MAFIDCEELFPQWLTARIILTEYVNGIKGWKLTRGPRNAMHISLDTNLDIEMMPEEDRPLVYQLVEEAVSGFMPDLTQFLHQPITATTEAQIRSTLGQHEADMVARGEPSLRDRISEALGIKGRYISNIHMRSVLLEH